VAFSNVTGTWMGMAKKNGDRFYDFVDSEIQYLSQEQKR
jgi:hypothetical protein